MELTSVAPADALPLLLLVGVVVTLAGLAVLVWCIAKAIGLRRKALPAPETRAALARLVPINLGALLLSAIGLMLVVIGIVLG